MFLKEGKILSLSDIDKSEFSLSENDIFFVMEHIEGINIDQVSEIKRESTFLNILDQITSVLFYLHQANYIYFDIKPENILVINTAANPTVKFIDFGLSSYLPNLETEFVKGTSEYLAPEILRNVKPDHRADLYSLGIMLYQLAYGRFPFNTENELEIFHAHLEKNFEFPSCRYSKKIVGVIRKLLAKDPENRYKSTLDYYTDLDREISQKSKLSFKPLPQFISNKNIVEKVDDFILPDSEYNILKLEGEKGSGKSEYLEYLNGRYQNSVLIRISSFVRSKNFWVQFFNKLIYSEVLYQKIDESLEQYISMHLNDDSKDLLSELKSIFAKISKQTEFILLIDDLEYSNPRIIEFINEIIPILQANNIKMILSAESSQEFLSGFENITEVKLLPFTDEEIKEIVHKSYADYFPKEKFTKTLLAYTDRNPSGINDFIFNMIVSGILEYSTESIIINDDPKLIDSIVETQENVYLKIYNELLLIELSVLEIVSIFKSEISVNIISEILGLSRKDMQLIVTDLRNKNILKSVFQSINPVYNNEGFKSFVYKNIRDVKLLHLKAADKLKELSLAETNTTIIIQYEFAERFDLAKDMINEALENESIIAYPGLKRRLLERKINYKLEETESILTTFDLTEVLIIMSEFKTARSVLAGTNKKKLDTALAVIHDKYLGIILINLGELQDGLKLLVKILNKIGKERNNILFEMANAQLELNNFEESIRLCNEIISEESANLELLGRVYNLLGLNELYKGNELSVVLKYFESAFSSYSKINNLLRIAAIQVNIGNIHNMMGNYSDAEKHWNKALQINQSIGNVDQEARLLLNYGIFHYEHAEFEEAIDLYQRAGNIFRGLGNKNGYGLVLSNLGESFLIICEYQKCLDALTEANTIFKQLKNDSELSEALVLLTKLYWIVGNKKKMISTIKEIEKVVGGDEEESPPLIKFINLIDDLLNEYSPKTYEKLKSVLDLLKERNENFMFAELSFFLALILLDHNHSEEINSILASKEIQDICSTNNYFEANRNYLNALITEIADPNNLELPLSFLKKGMALLESLSITELTISTLFKLSENYYIRGTLTKAFEYGNEYFNMIEYIIENMKSSEIKSSYINNPRTQNYLNKFKYLTN